jgi:uncharacterized protein involved in exopolysaccharide biosynthesis
MKRFNPRKRRVTIAGALLLVVVGIIGVVPWRVTAQEPGGLADKVLTQLVPGRQATARARLLVVPPESTSTDLLDRDSLMPTYKALITTDLVLKGALGRIPADHRVDLKDLPEDKQVDAVRRNLTVRTIRNTSILELRYRSKDPEAAVAVLSAVIDAYMDFLDRTHQSTDADVLRTLTKERANIEEQLRDKEEELRGLRTVPTRRSRAELRNKELQLARSAAALEEELLENRHRLTELLQHYTEKHPRVQSAKNRIKAIEAALALQTKDRTKAATSAHGNDAVQIQSLEAELARLRALFDKILDRIENIDLRVGSSSLQVRVVEPPRLLGRPGGREKTRASTKEAERDLIQAGDVLEISFTTKHSAAGVTVSVRVSDDGTADIPLIGSVRIDGVAPGRATETVRNACADRGVLPDAKVELKLRRETQP